MYIRKTIRESYKVRTDNRGSKDICFQYRSNVPGDFLVEVRSESPLGALYKIVFNLNNTLRNSNASKPRVVDQVKIVNCLFPFALFDLTPDCSFLHHELGN